MFTLELTWHELSSLGLQLGQDMTSFEPASMSDGIPDCKVHCEGSRDPSLGPLPPLPPPPPETCTLTCKGAERLPCAFKSSADPICNCENGYLTRPPSPPCAWLRTCKECMSWACPHYPYCGLVAVHETSASETTT